MPVNIRDDTFDRLVSTILTMMANLDHEQFNASVSPWQDVCMALDAVARLPPTQNHVYASFVTPLVQAFVAAAPDVPTWCLSQLARAASMPGVHHQEALAYVTERVNKLLPASGGKAITDDEASLVVDTLEAHARMPVPDLKLIEGFATRAIATNLRADARAQVAAIAERLDCLGDPDWNMIVMDRKWSNAGSVVEFDSKVDTECEAVLKVAVSRGDVRIATRAVEMVMKWGSVGALKLWRVVPYMEVRCSRRALCLLAADRAQLTACCAGHSSVRQPRLALTVTVVSRHSRSDTQLVSKVCSLCAGAGTGTGDEQADDETPGQHVQQAGALARTARQPDHLHPEPRARDLPRHRRVRQGGPPVGRGEAAGRREPACVVC